MCGDFNTTCAGQWFWLRTPCRAVTSRRLIGEAIDKKFTANHFDNWVIAWVIYFGRNAEHLLVMFFSVTHDSKLTLSGFWTAVRIKRDIWRRHVGLSEIMTFSLFYDILCAKIQINVRVMGLPHRQALQAVWSSVPCLSAPRQFPGGELTGPSRTPSSSQARSPQTELLINWLNKKRILKLINNENGCYLQLSIDAAILSGMCTVCYYSVCNDQSRADTSAAIRLLQICQCVCVGR